MRVVIIGGSGHVGTYLVPRLVRESGDPTQGDVIGVPVTGAGSDPSQAGGTARQPHDDTNEAEVHGEVLDRETPQP